MRGLAAVVVGAAVFFASTAAAPAECTINLGKSKGFKGSLVRTYRACPTDETPTVNTQTRAGIPACVPVQPSRSPDTGMSTSYGFGDKGSCSFQLREKRLSDCSGLQDQDGATLGLPAEPCFVAFLKARCAQVLQEDGDPVDADQDDGWTLSAVLRLAIEDPLGPMTMIDVPVTFDFSQPDNGSFDLAVNTAEGLAPVLGAGVVLPECTQMQVVSVAVRDPGGIRFAAFGQ